MAVATFTSAFVLLVILLASPLPTSVARKLPETAPAPMPDINTQLQHTLDTFASLLSQLIHPEGECNLESTTVLLIHDILKSIADLDALLCQNSDVLESYVLAVAFGLQEQISRLKPLVNSIPAETLDELAGSMNLLLYQIGTYVAQVVVQM